MTKNSDGLYQLSTEQIRKILPRIIELRLPLRRKTKDGHYSFIPAKDFDYYLKDIEMAFFVDEETLQRVAPKRTSQQEPGSTESSIQAKPAFQEKDRIFEDMLKDSASMDLLERLQLLLSHNHRMNGYIEERRKFDPAMMKEVGASSPKLSV